MTNRELNCPILVKKGIPVAAAALGEIRKLLSSSISNDPETIRVCTDCPNWDEETQTGECFFDTKRKSPSREVKYGS